MADMMTALKGILGDGAEEKIKTAMSMLSQVETGIGDVKKGNSDVTNSEGNGVGRENERAGLQIQDKNFQQMLTPEGIQFFGQIKSMFDKASNTDDSRSELLRSLRPFMRTERQKSIDRVIRVMNIGRLSGLFGK